MEGNNPFENTRKGDDEDNSPEEIDPEKRPALEMEFSNMSDQELEAESDKLRDTPDAKKDGEWWQRSLALEKEEKQRISRIGSRRGRSNLRF